MMKLQMPNEIIHARKEIFFCRGFLTIRRPLFGIARAASMYHSTAPQLLSTEANPHYTSARVFFPNETH
jgi:hypothetical protein